MFLIHPYIITQRNPGVTPRSSLNVAALRYRFLSLQMKPNPTPALIPYIPVRINRLPFIGLWSVHSL